MLDAGIKEVIRITNDQNETVVKVYSNGLVEYGSGYTADNASKKFWEAMGKSFPWIKS